VSDPTGTLATPLEPVTDVTSRRGRARLRGLIAEVSAERVVVGLPLSLSGADSAQTAEAREFAAALDAAVDIPVELYDERFTTRLAERTPGRASADSRAAAHLLESWLASRRAEEIASG
jgi:putative Holliday junction resolvase